MATTPDVYRSEDIALYQHGSLKNIYDIGLMNIDDTVSISTMISSELQNNLKRLFYISMLKDNWNGNGAKAFTQDLICRVRNIIISLNKQPELFPTPANSIQLEYEGDGNSYLEIEITELNTAEVYRIDRDGREDTFLTNTDANALNKMVTAFYE